PAMNERAIFFEALDLAGPAERAAFLDRACAGDAALRQRVEALLLCHANAGDFLARPAPQQLAAGADTPERVAPTSPPPTRPPAAPQPPTGSASWPGRRGRVLWAGWGITRCWKSSAGAAWASCCGPSTTSCTGSSPSRRWPLSWRPAGRPGSASSARRGPPP